METQSEMDNEAGCVGPSTESTYKSEPDTADGSFTSNVVPYCDLKTPANAAQTLPDIQQQLHRGSDTNSTNQHSLAIPDTLNMPEGTKAGNVLMPATTQQDTDTIPSLPASPRHQAAEDLPLILCSLSIDSLHCIASFLSPVDWSNFGQANHATNRVCNQVFRRVRMHGFRCATEVVCAWVSYMLNSVVIGSPLLESIALTSGLCFC